jgi:hypothetical protein
MHKNSGMKPIWIVVGIVLVRSPGMLPPGVSTYVVEARPDRLTPVPILSPVPLSGSHRSHTYGN